MNQKPNNLLFPLLRLGLGLDASAGAEVAEALQRATETADQQWSAVFVVSNQQGVTGFVWDGLQALIAAGQLPAALRPSRELTFKWYATVGQIEQRTRRQQQLAEELAAHFAAEGIRTAVLKGVAVGRLYPQPLHRYCSDLDCFLLPDAYERGNFVAERLGARVERNHYKHSHINYRGLTVENHQFCTPIRANATLRRLERLLEALLNSEGTTPLAEGSALECPPPMFNALFLTVHAHRHYLYEEMNLRQLADWAMFLARGADDLDWPAFRAHCDSFGMRHFADTLTRLANAHFGVPVPKGYELAPDPFRDAMLLSDILADHAPMPEVVTLKDRLRIARVILRHRPRYRYFSDTSLLADFFRLVRGFVFERTPKL